MQISITASFFCFPVHVSAKTEITVKSSVFYYAKNGNMDQREAVLAYDWKEIKIDRCFQ